MLDTMKELYRDARKYVLFPTKVNVLLALAVFVMSLRDADIVFVALMALAFAFNLLITEVLLGLEKEASSQREKLSEAQGCLIKQQEEQIALLKKIIVKQEEVLTQYVF